MQLTTAHWFNLKIINCIKCCHFPYRNIVTKLKSQYYIHRNIKYYKSLYQNFSHYFADFYLLISPKMAPKQTIIAVFDWFDIIFISKEGPSTQ